MKIKFRKLLKGEPLREGDMWADKDPNHTRTTELAQLHLVDLEHWGRCVGADDSLVRLGNGAYWRPTGIAFGYAGVYGDEEMGAK